MARRRIPVILLAWLAMDVSVHGKGLGSALPKDALLRAALAADAIGAKALLVHPRSSARTFFEHFSFEVSPSDPYHLLLIMKDLMRIIAG